MWFRAALAIGVYVAAVAETSLTETSHNLQICWLILVASLPMWRLPATEAAGWGAAIGLMCDAVSAAPLGLHLIALSMAVWGAAICRDRWLGQSLAAYGVLTMIVTAVVILSVAFGRQLLIDETMDIKHVAMVAAGAAAATGLCGLLIIIGGRTLMYAAQANGLVRRGRVEPRSA
ncbi:MAG: rod shape-determining protein MreD [Planctomycetaceae bacterium]|nr:rod shape-determining protein MreD [Planctomycetaceae bacterium]